MIKGVKFVSVPVRDQKAAVKFWTEKIGFKVLTDQQFDDKQHWIELGMPGQATGVVLFLMEGWEDRIGKFMNCTFFSDDVKKTYEEMKAKGVEFVKPPKTEPWGTSAIFKDPEGTQFLISSK